MKGSIGVRSVMLNGSETWRSRKNEVDVNREGYGKSNVWRKFKNKIDARRNYFLRAYF